MFKQDTGLGKARIDRFLNMSHGVGALIFYWVLPSSGIPESRITVQRLTETEKSTDTMKLRIEKYNKKIRKRFKKKYN